MSLPERRFVYTFRERSIPGRSASAVNLKTHGLDFAEAPIVFAGTTFTYEDDRLSYRERRYVTLGLLASVPVSIVHTEHSDEIRIISFRRATRRETRIYFAAIENG